MNKQSTQPGIVSTLIQLAALTSGMDSVNHLQHANMLLTNGYRAPIPGRILNQRQRRRDARRAN